MKLKALFVAVLLAAAVGPRTAFAVTTYRDMFKQTEGAVLDFAIASAVEPGYFRDMIGGRNMGGAQMPILFVTPYLDLDWGYVTGYDEKSRGTLMIGGTLRVNRLLNDYFFGKVNWVRSTVPIVNNYWNQIWFGPFIAHNFTDDSLFGGIKAGLEF